MNTNAVSLWIAGLGIWPLIVILAPNLMFRRFGQAAGEKRKASLYQAMAVFLITTLAAFIVERELTDSYFYAGLLVILLAFVMLRKKTLPYRFNCAACEKKLDIKTIYFIDNNLCGDCRVKKNGDVENKET